MRNPFETAEFGQAPDLLALANAPIRSPATSRRAFRRRLQTGLDHAPKALIYLTFCSLRLSVRTPPFHGGESGSIPLGSAIATIMALISFLFSRFPPNPLMRFG